MKRNKTWYKPKGYLHFSPKLKDIHKSMVSSYIEKDLDNHNFFPLIHETLIARRYKQYLDKDNKVYRSHYNASKKKSSKKPREIFYANHLDAHIYSFFANEILGKEYENILKLDQNLSDSIIAYRKIPITSGSKKNKCNIQFAEEVFKEIEKRTNCVVVCYDIENFFPSLNHQYLETCWENLLKKDLPKSHKKVLSSLTRYSYVELNDVIKVCRNEELKMFHKNDFRKSDLNSYFLTSKEFRTKM